MDVFDPTKLEAGVATAVQRDMTFFETHPRAIAIGSFVFGVVLTLLVTHFL